MSTSASAGLPSPAAIGALLFQIADDHERFDMMAIREPWGSRAHAAGDSGRELMALRRDALQELILTVPACDLPDCAAQLIAAYTVATRITEIEPCGATLNACAARLRRAIASVLIVVARLAGADLAKLSWDFPPEGFADEFLEEAAGMAAPKPAGR